MTDNSNDILVYALGGICEVGKNCYVVEYKDELILIDSGSIFPNKSMKGIDLVIPNFSRLKSRKNNIVGLFITHGHEDHIGAIPYLLREIDQDLKIFATGLAATLIRNKCAEKGLTPNIIDYNDKTLIKSKYFQISFFAQVHSIPDAHGILIKTHLGYIMSSGDFKFDLTPIGNKTNFKKIVRASQEGVLCLLSDSTNSLTDEFSYSEKRISKSIKNIIKESEGRVIVSTFASNIYRVQQIVDASVDAGRKILIFGRSMKKNVAIGDDLNYINAPKNTFIEAKEMKNYRSNEITIICTGSQGETLAALSRIAKGTHRDVHIKPSDTVIFSSSAIPGNQENISETINRLYKLGANVIINSPLNDTHTTGHASKIEQLLLLNLVEPKYFIPMHGEYHMLKTHARTAVEYGIPKENIFVLEGNGQVVRFNEEGAHIGETFYCEDVFIDGGQIFDFDNTILRQRKTLSEHGVVIIIASISKKNHRLATRTLIVSRGFIYMKTNEGIITRIKEITDKMIYIELDKDKKSIDTKLITSKIQENVSKYIYSTTERNPIITIKVMLVD